MGIATPRTHAINGVFSESEKHWFRTDPWPSLGGRLSLPRPCRSPPCWSPDAAFLSSGDSRSSLGHQQRNCQLHKLISSSRSQVVPGGSITRNKALSVKIPPKLGLMTRVARVKPSRDSACRMDAGVPAAGRNNMQPLESLQKHTGTECQHTRRPFLPTTAFPPGTALSFRERRPDRAPLKAPSPWHWFNTSGFRLKSLLMQRWAGQRREQAGDKAQREPRTPTAGEKLSPGWNKVMTEIKRLCPTQLPVSIPQLWASRDAGFLLQHRVAGERPHY